MVVKHYYNKVLMYWLLPFYNFYSHNWMSRFYLCFSFSALEFTILSESLNLSVMKWKIHPRTEFRVLEQPSQEVARALTLLEFKKCFRNALRHVVGFLGLSSAGPGVGCWWTLWGPSKISDTSAYPKIF